MHIELLKEDKIDEIVKFCLKIFEMESNEYFATNLNVVQTFQQLTVVRNLFFNNVCKAVGELDNNGEIQKIMIVRLADSIEYTAGIEIIIATLEMNFFKNSIFKLSEYFSGEDYSKFKINIYENSLTKENKDIFLKTGFEKELEYKTYSGLFQIYSCFI